MSQKLTFTLQDVVSMGFEARCVGPDGARYLWHGDSGIRTERTGRTLLLTDPAALPDSVWFATRMGIEELDEAAALERKAKTASRGATPSTVPDSLEQESTDAGTATHSVPAPRN